MILSAMSCLGSLVVVFLLIQFLSGEVIPISGEITVDPCSSSTCQVAADCSAFGDDGYFCLGADEICNFDPCLFSTCEVGTVCSAFGDDDYFCLGEDICKVDPCLFSACEVGTVCSAFGDDGYFCLGEDICNGDPCSSASCETGTACIAFGLDGYFCLGKSDCIGQPIQLGAEVKLGSGSGSVMALSGVAKVPKVIKLSA